MVRLNIVAILWTALVAHSQDPFLGKENAVGYIVLEKNGKSEKYIVVETANREVKLIRTDYNPGQILKSGGKKK